MHPSPPPPHAQQLPLSVSEFLLTTSSTKSSDLITMPWPALHFLIWYLALGIYSSHWETTQGNMSCSQYQTRITKQVWVWDYLPHSIKKPASYRNSIGNQNKKSLVRKSLSRIELPGKRRSQSLAMGSCLFIGNYLTAKIESLISSGADSDSDSGQVSSYF